MVVLVPAEQGFALGDGDGTDQITRVGKKLVGFRHRRNIQTDGFIADRRVAQIAHQLPGVDEASRQLIRAEQVIGQRQPGIGRNDVRAQMHLERLQGALRDGAGRNREA